MVTANEAFEPDLKRSLTDDEREDLDADGKLCGNCRDEQALPEGIADTKALRELWDLSPSDPLGRKCYEGSLKDYCWLECTCANDEAHERKMQRNWFGGYF